MKEASEAPPARRRRPTASPAVAAPVVWRSGVHVVGTGLYCDSPRTHDLCFLSSAQLGALPGPHRPLGAVLCSERTWRLYEALARPPRPPASLLLSPTGRPFQLGPLRMELFPSGALVGATSLWLRLPSGMQLVYAGAPNPVARPAIDAMELRRADALVCHAPLAAVDAALPTREAALADLQAWLAATRAAGASAVVLCPPLGTAPEVVAAVAAAGPVYAHPRVLAALRAYRPLNLPALAGATAGAVGRVRGRLAPGSLFVAPWPCPPDWLPAELVADGAAVRVALFTAAALLPEAVAGCQALLAGSGLTLDRALPYPDAIDRPGLSRYVADSEARLLYLTAGYSDEVAARFRPARVHVEPLGPPSQLALFP